VELDVSLVEASRAASSLFWVVVFWVVVFWVVVFWVALTTSSVAVFWVVLTTSSVAVVLGPGVGEPPPAMIISNKRASSARSGGVPWYAEDMSLSAGDFACSTMSVDRKPGERSQLDEMSDSGVLGPAGEFNVLHVLDELGVLTRRFLTRGGDNNCVLLTGSASSVTVDVVSWTTMTGVGVVGDPELGPVVRILLAVFETFASSDALEPCTLTRLFLEDCHVPSKVDELSESWSSMSRD
jgi:hypothetical protein